MYKFAIQRLPHTFNSYFTHASSVHIVGLHAVLLQYYAMPSAIQQLLDKENY